MPNPPQHLRADAGASPREEVLEAAISHRLKGVDPAPIALLGVDPVQALGAGIRSFGFRGLGFRGLGFRGFGFRGLRFKG